MITIQDALKLNAPKSVDSRYLSNGLTVFPSVAAANTATTYRHPGLTVLIADSFGFNVEYWYKDGVQDEDLELKTLSQGADGITIGNDNIPRLGGTFSQDVQIDMVDHALRFSNSTGTHPTNFFEIDALTGIDSLFDGISGQTSTFKVDGSHLGFSSTITGASSSQLNILGDSALIRVTDASGNASTFNTDSSSGSVNATLKISNTAGDNNQSIFITPDFIRIGNTGVDESDFKGYKVDTNGIISILGPLEESTAPADLHIMIDSNGQLRTKASDIVPDITPTVSGDATLNLATTGFNGRVALHPAFVRRAEIDMSWGSAYTLKGMNTPAITGTETFPAPATTNFITQTRRSAYASSASAGFAAGVRGTTAFLWRGNASQLGGFFFSIKFAVPVVTTDGIVFAGLRANTAAFGGTTLPSASLNIIGVAKEAADTSFQFIRNDASGTAVKVDTGLDVKTGSVYQLVIFCKPNDTQVYISLQDISVDGSDTGNFAEVTYDATVDGDLPDNSTLLSYHLSNANNATATAVEIDFMGLVIEN